MRLYLDANPIIYSIEGVPEFRLAALSWIERAEAAQGAVITSRLSRLECRVKPLREGNSALLEQFDGFFSRGGLEIVDVLSRGFRTTVRPIRRTSQRSPSCWVRRATRPGFGGFGMDDTRGIVLDKVIEQN